MSDKEKLKQIAINTGGKDWSILVDAVDDIDFHKILTNQQRNLLGQVKGNPNQLPGLGDYFADIISKYVSWKIYRESNLRDLNQSINDLSEQVNKSKDELQTIRDTAKHIGGATVLVKYSESFAKTAVEHGNRAKKQLKWYFISLLIFLIIAASVFFLSIAEFSFLKGLIAYDLNSLPLNTGFFALKAFMLVFVYQIAQFFKKNYNAEKHLQEVYQHRSDVLQSLHAVYNALTDMHEKDKILSAGVLFAYERGETGYITTKEGAGSGDGIIEGILGRVFK